jgi:hypothetical protein
MYLPTAPGLLLYGTATSACRRFLSSSRTSHRLSYLRYVVCDAQRTRRGTKLRAGPNRRSRGFGGGGASFEYANKAEITKHL